jgi:hypothetical protein
LPARLHPKTRRASAARVPILRVITLRSIAASVPITRREEALSGDS